MMLIEGLRGHDIEDRRLISSIPYNTLNKSAVSFAYKLAHRLTTHISMQPSQESEVNPTSLKSIHVKAQT
jgi:hypothetical protein